MSIIRTKHNRQNPFVQLSKKTLWDENLSLKAVGLWSRCMSRPDDWQFNVAELIKKCKEGRAAIYKAIKELIDNGYCIRVQHLEGENGSRWGQVEYFFYEFKVTQEDIDELKKLLPLSTFPHTVFPHTENRPLLIKKNKDIDNTKTTVQPTPQDVLRTGDQKFLNVRKNVKLTQKQYDKLKKDYPDYWNGILDKLSEYKETLKQEYNSDWKAINRWAITAVTNDINKSKAQESIKAKNIKAVEAFKADLDKVGHYVSLKIEDDKITDTSLNKYIGIYNAKLPEYLKKWYPKEFERLERHKKYIANKKFTVDFLKRYSVPKEAVEIQDNCVKFGNGMFWGYLEPNYREILERKCEIFKREGS